MCEHGDTVTMRVPVPAELSHSGRNEWKAKPVDRCLAPLVAALNDGALRTVASCCGHGKQPGRIALDDGRELVIAMTTDQADRMEAIYGRQEEESDGE